MSVQDISPDSIPDDIGTPGKGDSVDTVDLGDLPLSSDGFAKTPAAPQPKQDTPSEPEAPESEPEKESEPASEATEDYTEADLVKELGLGEYKTVKEAMVARDTAATEQVNALKGIFSKVGIDLIGNNLSEITQELEYLAKNNPATAQPQPTKPDVPSQASPVSLDAVYQKYADKIDLHDDQKALFQEMMGVVAHQIRAELSPILRDASTVPLLLDHQWYNDAKASVGDAPIPPFDEARRLLNANPKLRDWATQRREIFGDMNANPMKDVFSQWAGAKNSLGLTNAETAKRDEQAIKARNFKRTLTPGSVPKVKPKTPSQMNNKELGEAMHNIPIHEAFPRG